MIRSAVRFRGLLILLVLSLLPALSRIAAAQDDVIVLEEEKPEAAGTPKQPELSLAPDKEPEETPTNYQTFYDKWRLYIESVQKGDDVAAQNAANALLELKKAQSVPKLTEFAISALRLGRQKLNANDPRSAQHFFGIATQLDPTLPAAYYNQATASLRQGIPGVGGALVSSIRGFLAPRQHLRGRVYFNSKMAFLGIATLMLAASVFALVLLLKYNHLLLHDAVEKYSRRTGPKLIHLGVWLILFAPILLFLGILWLAPYWLMIFIRYARVQERIAALILIPVFLLAGPAFQKAVYDAALLQDSGIAVFYTVFLEGPSPRAIQDLQAHLGTHPDDWDSAVLLASLYQRNQMLNQAIELLQNLMSSDPQDARPPNNLASIYFSRGELDYALQLAQKAEGLDSGNAAYKFNLSNIYRAKFDFNEANSFMSEARSTNAALVDELEQTSHEKVVEVIPTPEILTRRLHGKSRSFATFLWNPFTLLGALLLLGAIYRISKNGKLVTAKECIKCGKAFCKKCQPNTKVPGFCIQCLHIFVRKDGVSPASRKEKMGEIEHFSHRQRIFSRIASLVIPGAGYLLQNRTVPGLLLLLPWFLLLSLAGFTMMYAGTFFFEPAEARPIIPYLCAALMVVLYAAANLPLSRRAKPA